jgi:hypothetical protein
VVKRGEMSGVAAGAGDAVHIAEADIRAGGRAFAGGGDDEIACLREIQCVDADA